MDGKKLSLGIPYGIRTRVAAVKGQCPRPLDERDICDIAKGVRLYSPLPCNKSSIFLQKTKKHLLSYVLLIFTLDVSGVFAVHLFVL